MATLQAVTFAVFALSLAAPAAAEPQSRFNQPRTQAGQMRFRTMDRNSDGVITKQEWRGSDQSFGVHDWNKDGILSGDEVREGFWATGEEPDSGNPAASERDDRFDYLDVNNNGSIERAEWHASDDAWTWLDRNNDNVLSRAEVVGNERSAVARTPSNPQAAGTSGQDCTSNAAEVVDDVYQQVLERSADQASAGLTQALIAGRMSVRDIVTQLAKSPEHADRFFWRPAATALYRTVMQRDPSQNELRDIMTDLRSRRGGVPGVVAGIAGRAESNPEDAVRILYRGLLGREADPEGLRGFTERARRDGIDAVARAIADSPEYRQRAGSDGMPDEHEAAYTNTVRSLYRHVLGRDPDAEGLRNLTRIATTNGFDAVVDAMVGSTEYERLVGPNGVPGRNVRYCGTTR
jgi:Ca2+-binding EF-hand superfamily protein